jgi:hypothetical protein
MRNTAMMLFTYSAQNNEKKAASFGVASCLINGMIFSFGTIKDAPSFLAFFTPWLIIIKVDKR